MIKTLIVGFGYAATTFHLPFIQHSQELSLAGVVSSDEDKVQLAAPNCPVWQDLGVALTQLKPDLVVITTPNVMHYSQARQCLEAGCHVLVEKPFTLSSGDALFLTKLAQQVGRKLCVYQNRRFDGDFLTVKALLDHGRLGRLKRFESRFDRFRPLPRDRWRENAGPGSGIFWDLGPHLVDQCLQLFGLPERICAHTLILRDRGQSDDSFEMTLFYSDFIAVLGSSPFQAGNTLRFDVQGIEGNYRKYGLDPQEQQLKSHMSFSDPKWAHDDESEQGLLCTQQGCDPVPTQKGEYLTFYQQLAGALLSDGPLPADAATVVDVIRVLELAGESSSLGRTLRFSA
ncbi:oxidoreductase [Alteromonas aestuariivivens]|uniref:Oxidoreductase n=1 Tax=Alteromonas aestuariivivens TaxID=1938339 RepID=A0A3D8M9V5_9ALTE|nr:Gfo/Idh/MocA family oxidoreductase [Alteromonas aestuariivivens]RDV26833.1 oxidoreductase [Alteromonas aestuariivivens]